MQSRWIAATLASRDRQGVAGFRQGHPSNGRPSLAATKCVLPPTDAKQIPNASRKALALAVSGEPGPVAVVIPFKRWTSAAG